MSKTSKEILRNAICQTDLDMNNFKLTNLDDSNLSIALPAQASNSGKFLTTDGSDASWASIPAGLGSQTANTVIAGPTTGSDAAPTFRALVAADVPNISAAKITSGALAATVGGTGQSSFAVGDILYASTTTALTKLGKGASGTFLESNGTIPGWSTLNFVIDTINPGELLVGGASNGIGVILADTATGNVLLSGGVGVAAAYGKVTSGHADTSLLKASNNLNDVAVAATARNNILPSQTGKSGKFLTNDGAGTITWETVAGSGSFTEFTFTSTGGFVGTVTNGTTAPTLSLTLGDSGDNTKTATLDCSNIATATNRVVNIPNANSTTAQVNAGASHHFLTAMSAQGVFSHAQPGLADISGYNAAVAPSFTTLTDGATITLTADATKTTQNRYVTLGGNRTLAFSGVVNGMNGVIIVIQDGTGGRTLTLPATSIVVNNGSGAVSLTSALDSVDVLAWFAGPSNIFWTKLPNFS